MPRQRSKSTAHKKKLFIEELKKGSSVARAAKYVGVSRVAAYNWRDDKDYAALWNDAVGNGIDLLEDVSRRRAVKGSDALLMMWLKCRRPEVWNPPPTPPAPPVDFVTHKITTVYAAVARMEQLGMEPLRIESDIDPDDE